MRGKGLEGNPSLNWLGAQLKSDSRSYYQTLAQSNSKESTVFQEYFCSFYFTLSRNKNKTKNWGIRDWIGLDSNCQIIHHHQNSFLVVISNSYSYFQSSHKKCFCRDLTLLCHATLWLRLNYYTQKVGGHR